MTPLAIKTSLFVFCALLAATVFYGSAHACTQKSKGRLLIQYLEKLCPRKGDTEKDLEAVEECCQRKAVVAGNQKLKRKNNMVHRPRRQNIVHGDPWIVQPDGTKVQYKGNALVYEFDQYGLAAYEYIFVDARNYITLYMRKEKGGQWLCTDLKGTTRFVGQAQRALAPCDGNQQQVAQQTPMVGLIRIGGYTVLAPPAREMRIWMAKLLTNKLMLATELNDAAQNPDRYWDFVQLHTLNLSRVWAQKQKAWLKAGEGSTTKASLQFEEMVKSLLKRCAALHLLRR